jgi:uncharacterized protein (TIRG00374 family)
MPRNQRLREIFKWLIKCLITISILYYLFFKIPFNQVFAALLNIKIIYLVPVTVLHILQRYILASQLRIFLQHQKMNFTTFALMKINFVTQFYALVLPGELSAGVVKLHKLSKQNKMRAQAAACIVLSRTINTLCLAASGIIFFLVEMPYNSVSIGTSLVFGLLAASLLYLSIINASMSSRLENLASKSKPAKMPHRLHEIISKVWNSMKQFHELRFATLNYSFFLSLLFQLAGVFFIYLIMQALGINVSIISLTWIRASVAFIQMLPISISGLGVREGAFVFLLKEYAVSGPDAMALSFIIFGVTVVMALIGGILEAQEVFFSRAYITGKN